MSRKSPTPQLVTGPLHKSCSEPISIIRTQHEGRAATPIAAVPAHSAADLSKFSSSHHLQQEHKQVFTEHFHAQMNAGHRPSEAGCKTVPSVVSFHDSSDKQSKTRQFGPHLLRLRELNVTTPSLDSSWEESNMAVPHIELVPAAPQSMSDASSQTDFLSLSGHRPKGKPNLYSMTPVELLNIPEPSYFRSSLSDKMSDYEDIWRSSCYDTDSVRNGSVRGHVYDEGSTVTAVSDFSKMIVFKRPKQPHQQIDGISALTDKSRQLEIVSLVPSQAPVKCPPHMDRLTRLKSSSESSLATLASPIYAEPADAIVLRDKRLRASKLKSRRRSAPSSAGQFGDTENNSKGVHVSKEPSLATILSPDAVKTQDSDSDKFDFELKPSHAAVRKLNTGISRSNSVRTPQEMARLAQKKPAWQERFKRLKLGTKVLTSQQSPYSASCQNSYHPQQMSFDDNLFVLEEDTLLDSGPSSFRPSLGKFPVYQQRQGHNKGVNRASYFSESSTMQDIISCAMPELLVRPIQTQIKIQGSKPLSEYDNFDPYAPPSTSSCSTIFCKPWEAGIVGSLIKSSASHLPPAMDLQERVQKWQEANENFHDHHSRTQQSQSALGSGGHHVDDEGSNSKSEVSTPMAELDTNTCESDHHSKVKMSQSQPGLPLLHLTRHHLQPLQQHAQPLTRSVSQPAHNTGTGSNLHQQQSLTVSHHQLTCPHNSQDSRHQQPPHVGHSPPNKTIDLPSKCVSSNHGKQNIHLSSTCPDVINCHHVKSQKARTVGQKDAMNNSLYPADEVLVDNLPYLDASLRQQIQPLACEFICYYLVLHFILGFMVISLRIV